MMMLWQNFLLISFFITEKYNYFYANDILQARLTLRTAVFLNTLYTLQFSWEVEFGIISERKINRRCVWNLRKLRNIVFMCTSKIWFYSYPAIFLSDCFTPKDLIIIRSTLVEVDGCITIWHKGVSIRKIGRAALLNLPVELET